MAKPRVNTNPYANHYSSPDERIIEFSFPDGKGGLISFRTLTDGTHVVSVYRTDPDVRVLADAVRPDAYSRLTSS